MFKYVIFLLLLFPGNLKVHAESDSLIPVLHQGRIRPLNVVPKEEQNQVTIIKDYEKLVGTPLIEATGKAIYYPSIKELRAELLLHKIPFKWLIIGGYLLFLLARKKPIFWTAFFLHTLLLALRCYVLKRPPVSNMLETLIYVPWIVSLAGIVFRREWEASGVALILLLFLPQNLKLDNVQAVLDSNYWLLIHVMMVVGSYGLFFLSGLCAHLFLLKPSPKLEKTLIQTMYVGTGLLICGTILGGVWAAESWGRFWDWDPKEAWAFISIGIYLIWIHAYKFKKIHGEGLAYGGIIGLMSITFTWYGVNYILGTGLHSYGFGSGGEIYYYLFLIFETIFLLLFKFEIYKKISSLHRIFFFRKRAVNGDFAKAHERETSTEYE